MAKFFYPLAKAHLSCAEESPQELSADRNEEVMRGRAPRRVMPKRRARGTRLSPIRVRRPSRKRTTKGFNKSAWHEERLLKYEQKERKAVEGGLFNWQDVLLALENYREIEVCLYTLIPQLKD